MRVIWIVLEKIAYNGGEILGVFSSLEKANNYILKYCGHNNVYIEEHTVDDHCREAGEN